MLVRASAAKLIGASGKMRSQARGAGYIAHQPDAADCLLPDRPRQATVTLTRRYPAALPARGGILRRRGYYGEA
jgi:hypothetical protein